MATITDRHGNVIREEPDTLEDWRQAAQVEAGLRREFQEKNVRLRAALKPFANAVFNDNGDMTITPCGIEEYAKAYFVMRDLKD